MYNCRLTVRNERICYVVLQICNVMFQCRSEIGKYVSSSIPRGRYESRNRPTRATTGHHDEHLYLSTVSLFFSRWSDVTESTVTIRSPFCGYNLAWCVELKAKLYEVIHIKLNQFTKMPIRSLAYCIKRIKALLQWPTFFSVLPTRWRRKPAGIYTEPNYTTLTLCISLATKLTLSQLQRQSILTSC